MNRKKTAEVITKIATMLDNGTITEAKAKLYVGKLTEKLEKAGKMHTASALKKIVAAEEPADEENPEEIEGIQKAVMAIYKARQQFIKVKNKRVRDIYVGLTGNDLLNMKIRPFLEMIANTATK